MAALDLHANGVRPKASSAAQTSSEQGLPMAALDLQAAGLKARVCAGGCPAAQCVVWIATRPDVQHVDAPHVHTTQLPLRGAHQDWRAAIHQMVTSVERLQQRHAAKQAGASMGAPPSMPQPVPAMHVYTPAATRGALPDTVPQPARPRAEPPRSVTHTQAGSALAGPLDHNLLLRYSMQLRAQLSRAQSMASQGGPQAHRTPARMQQAPVQAQRTPAKAHAHSAGPARLRTTTASGTQTQAEAGASSWFSRGADDKVLLGPMTVGWSHAHATAAGVPCHHVSLHALHPKP
eukprot:238270-Chlamydomonas_euryale.AAC.1